MIILSDLSAIHKKKKEMNEWNNEWMVDLWVEGWEQVRQEGEVDGKQEPQYIRL